MRRRTRLSATMSFFAHVGLACLATASLGSASTIVRSTASLSITGNLTVCGADIPISGPLNESSPVYASDGLGPVEMTCGDNSTNIASMHAQAAAHADTPPTIAVVASSTGAGASAVAEADFDDFAIIRAPLNSSVLEATFSITAPYTLSLSLPSLAATGAAVAELTVPLYGFSEAHLTNTGSLSGTLDTGDIVISGCPCTVEIIGLVTVRGSNGGGGSAKDPFTINLPPGWTYTLASEEQAAAVAPAPEPGTLSTIWAVLAAAAVIRFRRKGRRAGGAGSDGRPQVS